MDDGCIGGFDFAIIEMESDLMVNLFNDVIKFTNNRSYPFLIHISAMFKIQKK